MVNCMWLLRANTKRTLNYMQVSQDKIFEIHILGSQLYCTVLNAKTVPINISIYKMMCICHNGILPKYDVHLSSYDVQTPLYCVQWTLQDVQIYVQCRFFFVVQIIILVWCAKIFILCGCVITYDVDFLNFNPSIYANFFFLFHYILLWYADESN